MREIRDIIGSINTVARSDTATHGHLTRHLAQTWVKESNSIAGAPVEVEREMGQARAERELGRPLGRRGGQSYDGAGGQEKRRYTLPGKTDMTRSEVGTTCSRSCCRLRLKGQQQAEVIAPELPSWRSEMQQYSGMMR
ncbi:hypothetical protein Tdes44962_MAKER08552 [Teratosphaeria destructans]|uniref:Uncharacterized protein n=1 Tax=Teratosphaeria destructans TaxID=418781 RepID=A0A9W7W4T4_9PEZI|nr:hypothetical protein Tdes44962_MAKER08552 [Teratosphaeria destructans]